jgi:phage tail tape-measure protein
MDRHDDADRDPDVDSTTTGDGETHATTGGAAAAGAVTGGVIGLAGGPVGAAIGAVTGAIVGAAAERMMHSGDDSEDDRVAVETDLPTGHEDIADEGTVPDRTPSPGDATAQQEGDNTSERRPDQPNASD